MNVLPRIKGTNPKVRSRDLSAAALFVLFVLAVYPPAYSGQDLGAGLIHRQNGVATVQANGSRALHQAVVAIREEYGWIVDYEDPPYESQYDVGSVPWPAHPGSTWRVPANGTLKSTYQETAAMWTSTADELGVLQKIINDHNQNGSPGNFEVLSLSDGTYAVVGDSIRNGNANEKPVKPVLDTQISVPGGTRNVATTVALIAQVLTRASGTQVVLGITPINAFLQSSLTIEGTTLVARELLLRAVSATPWKMVWDLLYDPQYHRFVLNISIAERARYNTLGQRTLVPLAPPRVPGSP